MDREEDQVQRRQQVKEWSQNGLQAPLLLSQVYDHLQSGQLATESVASIKIKMAQASTSTARPGGAESKLKQRESLPPDRRCSSISRAHRKVISKVKIGSQCSFAKHRHNMLPGWRQVATLCFLSVLLTSLLATLNIALPSGGPTTCLQCHALTIDSKSTVAPTSTQPTSAPKKATGLIDQPSQSRNSWLPKASVRTSLKPSDSSSASASFGSRSSGSNSTTIQQQVKIAETNNGQLIPAASQTSEPSIIRPPVDRAGTAVAANFDHDEPLENGRLARNQLASNSSSLVSAAVPSEQSSSAMKLVTSPALVNTSRTTSAKPHWPTMRQDMPLPVAPRARPVKTSPRAATGRQVVLPQIIIGRPVERQFAAKLPIQVHLNRAHQLVHGSPSASAPSIALPPLSHLLTPRNPFRLFASAAPSRLRPQLFMQSSNLQTRYQQVPNQQQQHQSQGESAGQLISSLLSMPPPNLQDVQQLTSGRLYAHSHSAEQLEQLVRAASRATGVKSPILPAIVSAPSGAFPGFYIPALDSEPEPENRPSSSYGGDSAFSASSLTASASTSPGQADLDSISSKIPGTDYVLHPEEVRAMMNIGELAWRKQQEQADSHQAAASSELGRPGLMQENHMENARDFAYVDPPVKPGERLQSYPSANQLQASNSSQQAGGRYEALESQLSSQLRQNGITSLPAIIRVNNRDYIHWPLLQGPIQPHQEQRLNNGQESRQNVQLDTPSMSQGNNYRPIESSRERLPRSQLYSISAFNGFETPPGAAASNYRPMSESRFEPVRQVTQLSPSEIRQVEDSIIEALIVSQALKRQQQLRQRRLAENLAAVASQIKVSHVERPQTQETPKRLRLRDALFPRRRRRNSAQSTKQSSRSSMAKDDLLQAATVPHGLIFNVSNLAPGAIILAAAPVGYLQRPLVSEPIHLDSLIEQPRLDLQARPPPRVFMADQETNKPQLAASQPDQAADSSDTRPTMLGPLGEESFGKRVSASTMMQTQMRSVPLILIGSSPLAQLRNNPYIPQRSIGERKAGSNRISVDWPAMVSDADYFPSSAPDIRHERPSESRHVGHHGRAPSLAKQAAEWKPRQFADTHPKLQFSLDYQAREGVPLYNNNIRLVGATSKRVPSGQLDSARSAPQHTGSTGDEPGDEDSDEPEPDELQRGASETSTKAANKRLTPAQAASS